MIDEIGEVNSVGYDPIDETIELDGEYGLFRFETDAKTRNRLRLAIEAIEADN